MFSSLSKFSPKKLLASSLSLFLAQFFNVDPNRVESNLIKDTKVVLNDVEIKERRLGNGGDSYLRVGGSIKQIEFSWVWDGAALIKDVRLTVRGVSVNVRVIQETKQDNAMVSIDIDSLKNTSLQARQQAAGGGGVVGLQKGAKHNTETPPSDWKAKYMQQIIDHLTLAVTDITVAVHLHGDSKDGGVPQVVHLQANDMELCTLPNKISKDATDNSLMQTISLASIEVWVEQDDLSRKFPILEPFGYEATVTRVSGRRFLDGVLSGLLVKGTPIAGDSRASSTIRLHAGIRQIAGLNRLQQVLLLVGHEDADGAPRPTEKKSPGSDNSSCITATKSIFYLPFNSFEVVLENTTNLRLTECSVRYSTDGSELSFDCSGGVWLDGAPLSKDGRWVLDLVSCELLLDSLPHQEEHEGELFYSTHSDVSQPIAQTFQLNLSLDMFQKVYHSIMAIMPQCSEAKVIAEQTMDQYGQPTSLSSLWSMKSNGPVAVRFTGNNNTWVEIVADSPQLSQASSVSKGAIVFECKSTEVNSNAGFAIHIPHTSTDHDGNLCVAHRIAASVYSMDIFKVLQDIASDITNIVGGEPSSTGSIPIGISLAGFDVSFKDSQLRTINVSHISGSGTEWSIGLLQVNDVGDVGLDASSLQVSLGTPKRLFVQKIKRIAYNRVDYLATPIMDGITFVLEEGDVLSVSCKDIFMKLPDQALVPQGGDNKSQEQALSFPVSLHFTVERLRAESITTGNVIVNGVDFWARPAAESLMVDLNVKSVRARVKDKMELSCGKIDSSVEFPTAGCRDTNSPDISIPGLGQLSLLSASMTVHDIANFSTFAGQLSKPLDVVDIAYGGEAVTIKCNKVLFCTTSPLNTQSDGAVANLPIAVYFEANRLITMEDFGPGKPGLCFDGLQVHFTPSGTIIGIDATCNNIQGRGAVNQDFAAKGVKLNLSKNLLDEKNELLGLDEMHLSMSEVTTLSIPEKLKLARPVYNLAVQLKNNAIDVECDLIHISYIQESKQATKTESHAGVENNIIPVPFRITVDKVVIESSTTEVVCRQFSTQYTKASTTAPKSLHVGIRSVEGKFRKNVFKASGISTSTKWSDAAGNDHRVIMPYLGSLLFAQAELVVCTEMTNSSVSLIEPLHKPKLLFQGGCLTLALTKLQLNVINTATGSDSCQRETPDFDFLRVPISIKISNELRLNTQTFDLRFKNIGMEYTRSLTSPHGEVSIHCDRVEEITSMSAKKICLQLHLSLTGPKKKAVIWSTVFPGMEYVEKASMKINVILNLYVEGNCRLSRPLQNTTIAYQDGVFATDIEALQLEYLGFRQHTVLGTEKLSLRMESDPFDNSIRFTATSSIITSNGGMSFNVEGTSLSATIIPTTIITKEVSKSKIVVIPSFGYVSLVVLDVSRVSSLVIHDMGQITRPIAKLELRYEEDVITLGCPAIFLQRFVTKKKMSISTPHQGGPPFVLPCKTGISIGAFQLLDMSQDSTGHRKIQCRSLNLTLEPQKARVGQPNETICDPGIG